MELKRIAEEYEVSEELLMEFIKGGLLNDDLYENSDENQRLSSCICLYSLGLDISTIKEYFRLERLGKKGDQARIKILCEVRKKTLKTMHDSKEVLDCIEMFITEIKQNKQQ